MMVVVVKHLHPIVTFAPHALRTFPPHVMPFWECQSMMLSNVKTFLIVFTSSSSMVQYSSVYKKIHTWPNTAADTSSKIKYNRRETSMSMAMQ